VSPRAIRLAEELVETKALVPGTKHPLVLLAKAPDLDLAEWAEACREDVEARLLEHGALLFRGFEVDSLSRFERFAATIAGELYGDYGDLPREEISGKVYGATVYPEDKAILFHNEASHTRFWPLKIFFHCQEASPVGGETNLVDCRDIHDTLDPAVRERFRDRGLIYARCFNPGLDVSWQEYFRTTRREDVESQCRRDGIQCEWVGEDGLRTRQWRPAIARHPQTGAPVFFNQIQLHHTACLDPALRESLSSILAEKNWPRNVFYGDGARIEDDLMREIAALYARRAVAVAWKRGDVLLVDNMLTAHGRSPYQGRRKIAVAMGQMQSDPART
jgi:alpha-ketoglutarate-dependent taurine dioxygenase